MAITPSPKFCHRLVLAAILFQNAASLTSHQNPRFSSASEQSMFGGYSTGEASLFGGSSTMYGAPAQPLWKGKHANTMSSVSAAASTDTTPNVPFSGDRVESMCPR